MRVLTSHWKGSCLGHTALDVFIEELPTVAVEVLLPGLLIASGEKTGRTDMAAEGTPSYRSQQPLLERIGCLWDGECGLLPTSTWEGLGD